MKWQLKLKPVTIYSNLHERKKKLYVQHILFFFSNLGKIRVGGVRKTKN